MPYRFAAAGSGHPDAANAVGEVAGHVFEAIDEPPAFALVAVSGSFASRLGSVCSFVARTVQPESMLGVVVDGVLNGTSHLGASAVGMLATTAPLISTAGVPELQVSDSSGAELHRAPTITFASDAADLRALVGRDTPGYVGGVVADCVLFRNGEAVDLGARSQGAVTLIGGQVAGRLLSMQSLIECGGPFTVAETGNSSDGRQLVIGLGRHPAADELWRSTERAKSLGLAPPRKLAIAVDARPVGFRSSNVTVVDIEGQIGATGALAVGASDRPVAVGDTAWIVCDAPDVAGSEVRTDAMVNDRPAAASLFLFGRSRADPAAHLGAIYDAEVAESALGIEVPLLVASLGSPFRSRVDRISGGMAAALYGSLHSPERARGG